MPTWFAGAVSLVTLIAVAWHLFDRARFIRTDDALVNAHFTTLTAKVPGIVNGIYVREMQKVKQGQLLATIEDSDYRFRLTKNISAKESSEIVQNLNAKDYRRARELYQSDAISNRDLRTAETGFHESVANTQAGDAELNLAKINLAYTEIRAPADGMIAGRAISLGMMLNVGDPLYGFVYPSVKWIDARVKETDVRDLKMGEVAEVNIDAIPGKTFHGKIESIGPSTEGIEAVIPPDNAAGNFTKYVQRVPVRVALDLDPIEQEAVRVGLSAEVNIRRTHQ